jgi:site-specific recombinase XerD
MTVAIFFSPARPSNIRRLHNGPLGSCIDEYATRLSEQGLCRGTGMRTLLLIADLSRWLLRAGLGIDELNERTLERYRRFRARTRPLGLGDPVALRRFLCAMRDLDICKTPSPAPLSLLDEELEGFRRYLSQDVGLSARTLEHYSELIDPFLREQIDAGGPRWSTLTGAEVLGFFRRCARRRSPQYLQRLRTALRSFLRYLRFRGDVQVDLGSCIPGIARWSLATLPKYLTATQVQRVLGSCNRKTPVGRRDYAILLILARLGLRAIEVVELSLDDIDWETGQFTIRAKGRERATMPMPADVGQAICDYLTHGRPHSNSRRIFLRHLAPHVGFAKSASISAVCKFAMQRAGIDLPSQGAHLLRHTLATRMLRQGASLEQIGQLLRHRLLDTTRIYAKVDLIALRRVALPLPEGLR